MAQSSLCGRLSGEYEIKVSADKCFQFWSLPYHLANVCPKMINKVDLIEGEWGKPGCVIVWDYNFGGERVSVKEKMEVIDYDNKRVEFTAIEGNLLQAFKSFKLIVAFTSKGKGCSSVCSLEYEKLNENIPDPTEILDVVDMDVNKAIEASFN
ncbi:hypothetical protein ACFE04_018168 [Oxalis oulophora]